MAEPFKVLVVAAEEHIREPVRRELEKRAQGREAELRVVVPALADSPFQHAAGDVDEGLERAQGQLKTSLAEVSANGNSVRAAGQVGDPDPIRAIEDALYDFPADEIVVVTHDTDSSRWLEDELFDHAKKRFDPPITHFVVTNGTVEEVDRAEAGVEQPDEAAEENLPSFTPGDIAGIVFAVVGTLVLIVIATSNPDETAAGFDVDALHTIIAGAFALVNIAHVVGLVLFESVGYRGFVQKFFSRLSLYGTAAAIAVSLLLLLL